MDAIVWVLLGVCVIVIGAALFLWRRGAIAVDVAKAKAGAIDLMDDTKRDVSKWRDKLGK